MKTKKFFSLRNEKLLTIAVIAGGLYMIAFAATGIIMFLGELPREILFIGAIIAAVVVLHYVLPIPSRLVYIDEENKEKFKTANLKSLRGMLKRLKQIKGNTCPYFESEKIKGITEAISLCQYEIKKRKWQRILGKNVA